MSASLERIIRPAQTAGIRPSSFAVARTAPASNQSATLTWGGSGATVFELKASIQLQVQEIQGTELQRTYDVVKVKNPDDDTQFIQTEVLTNYQARNTINGGRINIDYQRQQDSQDIEIVSTGNIRKAGG
jgi:hypothetical protein